MVASLAASAQTVHPVQAAQPARVKSFADVPSQSESENSSYRPITGEQRFRWFVVETVRPQSLAAGVISAAYGTGIDKPKEYGPHWGGFADRYGMRFTGISTGNAMEAGFGALWGEDPRYFREPSESFGGRVKHVIKMTFVAYRREGNLAPAYARFIAVPGNNFLSNTWRADSEATARDAGLRTLLGFSGRMARNAFKEFWPDVKRHLFHKRQ